MKFLIIDSHKGSLKEPQNLHWLNAKQIKDHLITLGHEVDLIWSYPSVNEEIKSGYDRIIFNHASHYSYVDYKWLEESPNAELFHITNELMLGEPRALWMGIKNGRKYKVIANHPANVSKIVKKYVDKWHFVNLNALIVEEQSSADIMKNNRCIYYGSYRPGRTTSFQKFLQNGVTISTHKKNREKFEKIGVNGPFIDRLNWSKNDLAQYSYSLYIEDDVTHTNYNHLANRFYEALNNNVIPLFDSACADTLAKSNYNFPAELIIDSSDDIKQKINGDLEFLKKNDLLIEWRKKALEEKGKCLKQITTLIS
jgi:hypothetical protein